jgi:hypothetical protein
MPRGAKSLKSSGAVAACDEVVSRLTSPENGVAVKNACRVVERPPERGRPRRHRFVGNRLIGRRVGDRHRGTVVLQDAALDVAQAPGGIAVVVASVAGGIVARRNGRDARGKDRPRFERVAVRRAGAAHLDPIDTHAFAARRDIAGVIDTKDVLAGGQRLDDEAATRVGRRHRRREPKRRNHGIGEWPAVIVDDDPLDATEGQAGLLAHRRGQHLRRRRPHRQSEDCRRRESGQACHDSSDLLRSARAHGGSLGRLARASCLPFAHDRSLHSTCSRYYGVTVKVVFCVRTLPLCLSVILISRR